MPVTKEPRTTRLRKRKTEKELTVYEHINILYNIGLYEDVVLLNEVTNLFQNNGSFILPKTSREFMALVQIARSYENTRRTPLAEVRYEWLSELLPIKERCPKLLQRDGNKLLTDTLEKEIFQEYHDCLIKLKRNESNSFCEKNDDRTAPWFTYTFNIKTLEKNKSSLGSATYIFVNDLKNLQSDYGLPQSMIDVFAEPHKSDITLWLKAQQNYGQKMYEKVIECLESMSHTNSRILTELAKIHFKLGRTVEAKNLLIKAHKLDRRWVDGMDRLAYLLGQDKSNVNLLESITADLLKYNPIRPETYIASGYLLNFIDPNGTTKFALKSIAISDLGSDQYCYSNILKADCMKKSGMISEAIQHLKGVLRYDNHNNEILLTLIELLLEQEEFREAKTLANEVVASNPKDINAKFIKVHVMVTLMVKTRTMEGNNSIVANDVIKTLEELLTQHPRAIDGVVSLLQELHKTKNPELCETLLKMVKKSKLLMPFEKTVNYHKMMTEYCVSSHRPVNAYKHLVAAMGLGHPVTSSYLSALEMQFRMNGIADLDHQLNIPVSDSSTSTSCSGTTSTSSSSNTSHDHDYTSSIIVATAATKRFVRKPSPIPLLENDDDDAPDANQSTSTTIDVEHSRPVDSEENTSIYINRINSQAISETLSPVERES